MKLGNENYFVLLLNTFLPANNIFLISIIRFAFFLHSVGDILQRSWIVQKCPSPVGVGADEQSAWVILDRLDFALTFGCHVLSSWVVVQCLIFTASSLLLFLEGIFGISSKLNIQEHNNRGLAR